MKKQRKPIFMIHKHHATHLHYDLRLEIEGTLKSWALRKLPMKSSQTVRAVQVPDHPFWYRHFEGVIPEGEYGAGPVMVWDKGLYSGFMRDHHNKKVDLEESVKRGCMLIWLEGKKLQGGYILFRTTKKQQWFIIKMADEFVHKGRLPKNWNRSVKSNMTMSQIKAKFLKKLL